MKFAREFAKFARSRDHDGSDRADVRHHLEGHHLTFLFNCTAQLGTLQRLEQYTAIILCRQSLLVPDKESRPLSKV